MEKLDMKRVCKRLIDKKYKRILFAILAIFVLNSLISVTTGVNVVEKSVKRVLESVGIYTEEIKSIEIKSDGYDEAEPGAWKVTKSAEWTSTTTVESTIDVETILKNNESVENKNKDVILVLNLFGEQENYDNLPRVKEEIKELTNYILADENNSLAFVTSNNSITNFIRFTKDKEVVNNTINNMSINQYTRNYTLSIINIQKILADYTYDASKEVVVLFLTDGAPTTDTPNQIAEYQILKDKYPFVTVKGLQYNAGSEVENELEQVSDFSYATNVKNFRDILFDSIFTLDSYVGFEISDLIDTNYFQVENADNIKVSNGLFTFDKDTQKIVWNITENVFKTNQKATMTINLTLNSSQSNVKKYFPINKEINVKSKIGDNEEIQKNSNKTPVLKNFYTVIYDTNPPTGCNIKQISEEIYFSFDSVNKKTELLSCSGYVFKGWEIAEDDVIQVNSDVFTMPGHDVNVRGTWAKVGISKSMNGKIFEKATLWGKIQDDAQKSINRAFTLEGTEDDEYPIYYYNSDYYYDSDTRVTVEDPKVENGNVIFANYCWLIVRTTETGGVKLLYNGEPQDGICDDLDENKIIGKTHFVSEDYDTTRLDSIAEVGYMYNSDTAYYRNEGRDNSSYQSRSILISRSFLPSTSLNNTNYYYSKEYTYDSASKSYSLVEPKQFGNWNYNYTKIEKQGYYTCSSSSSIGTCTTLYLILSAEEPGIYGSNGASVLYLSNGETIETNTNSWGKDVTLGTDYVKNDDGTYSLENTENVKKVDYGNNPSKYLGYYMCGDTSCSTMLQLVKIPSNGDYAYGVDVEKDYVFGSNFTYDSGNYHLTSTKKISELDFSQDVVTSENALNGYRYTCLSTNNTCHEIFYIFNISGSAYELASLKLRGGDSIGDALNKMLHDENVNKYDSDIKVKIDEWYKNNLISFTSYLEDTVWCNNRSVVNYAGFDPEAMTFSLDYLVFNLMERGSWYDPWRNVSLTCPNNVDKFTVSSSLGNGKLKYPIALITAQEAYYMGENYLGLKESYWTMTPANYYFSGMMINTVYGGTRPTLDSSPLASSKFGIRPAISLRPGIEYIYGDGTKDNPYVIDQSELSLYNITSDNPNITFNKNKAGIGTKIYVKYNDYIIQSFKLNGVLVEGNSFEMPAENVTITDVVYQESYIVESKHYSSNIDAATDKIYLDKTFEGAKSLTVTLDYETDRDYKVKLYDVIDSNDTLSEYYGTNGKKSATIVIDGNYLKITYSNTSYSLGSKYGFRARVTPNYEGHQIITSDANIISSNKNSLVGKGVNIKLKYNGDKIIQSFKLNGTLIEGDNFEMPNVDAVITDVVLIDGVIIESKHYRDGSINFSYEKTFEGASTLKIILDYENSSSIYVYDTSSTSYGTYPVYRFQSYDKKAETVYIDGNYLKVSYNSSYNNDRYYGFKAKVIPMYDKHQIKTNDSNIVLNHKEDTVTEAAAGSNIILNYSGDKEVTSFKLNGELIEGNSFVMPEENANITDVVLITAKVIESEHNPYPNSLNTTTDGIQGKVYGTAQFPGAKSLTIRLDIQTESTSYDWVYLYDSASSTTPLDNKKYGGTTRTTHTITVNSDYVKIVFRTDGSGNTYYGFKATVIPNY